VRSVTEHHEDRADLDADGFRESDQPAGHGSHIISRALARRPHRSDPQNGAPPLRRRFASASFGRPWGWDMRSLALILASVISMTPAARAEKRVALVIGNGAYKNVATLQNLRNDATDVSGAASAIVRE
jgi:hypothetical protein